MLDWPEFSQQVSYQGDLARGLIDLPYIRQFGGTVPVVYELQNLVVWGLGLLLGLAALAGLLWVCWKLWNHKLASWWVPLAWIVVYAGVNCTFFTKYMRYLLPIYPLLALLAATLLVMLAVASSQRVQASLPQTPEAQDGLTIYPIVSHWHTLLHYGSYVLIGVVLLGTLFQCLALDNVYSQANTRIQASEWIYAHLKPGTVLTYEQWDDALPVALPNHDPGVYPQAVYTNPQGQATTGLPLYDDDTTAKAQTIAKMLMQTGAITMPTDRLDKSIPRLPERYPLTIHYYALLFSGELGFHLAAQFEVRPSFLGITLDDSGSDESYSVFDHPNARIYVRDNPFPFQSADQIVSLLFQNVHLPPSNPQQLGVPASPTRDGAILAGGSENQGSHSGSRAGFSGDTRPFFS